MDIPINNTDVYFVYINIIIRYAVFESILNKTIASVLIVLKSFFKRLKIKSLESDEEASFISKPVLKYLDKKNIDY
jgi:hypothetical protein